MTKADRGTKRACAACGAKFYDLNRDPVVCPVCEAAFKVEEAATPVRVVEVVEEEPEVPAKTEAAVVVPEIISLDEAEAEGADGDAAIDEDDVEVVDLGDDEEEIPEPDEDDTFLEEDDEEEPDVTTIVRSPLDADEER